MPQSGEVHHTIPSRTRTPHNRTPRTSTLPAIPATSLLPLATSSLLPKCYRQSRFTEHLEDEAQLADPVQGRSAYEPPESEDGAESQRRLEAALSHPSDSPSASAEHYVQQFDLGGHPVNPASRTAVREMVRAQNDMLATVGVCYGIAAGDKGSPLNRAKSERDNLESGMRENGVGLFVGAADLGTLNWWLDGIRHRIQVFKTFSDISFNGMFRIQRKHYGLQPEVDSSSSATWPLTGLREARDWLIGALWAGKRWFRWARL